MYPRRTVAPYTPAIQNTSRRAAASYGAAERSVPHLAGATEWPQVDTKQEDAMRVATLSRVRWFALVALMALLVAACGGGGTEETESEAPSGSGSGTEAPEE